MIDSWKKNLLFLLELYAFLLQVRLAIATFVFVSFFVLLFTHLAFPQETWVVISNIGHTIFPCHRSKNICLEELDEKMVYSDATETLTTTLRNNCNYSLKNVTFFAEVYKYDNGIRTLTRREFLQRLENIAGKEELNISHTYPRISPEVEYRRIGFK